jgi:hypothetical protein
MPVLVPVASATGTVLDLIKDAMIEINLLALGQEPSGEDASYGLRKLNRLMDTLTARKVFVYAHLFTQYTTVASRAVHTIGPGGDFDVTAGRPIRIVSAAWVLDNDVNTPVDVQDADWWSQQSIPSQTSTIPTDLYYEPEFPLGKVSLWPIPTVAGTLQLETESLLTQFTALTQAFAMPPGYWDLITYALSISLVPPGQAIRRTWQRWRRRRSKRSKEITLARNGFPCAAPDCRAGDVRAREPDGLSERTVDEVNPTCRSASCPSRTGRCSWLTATRRTIAGWRVTIPA